MITDLDFADDALLSDQTKQTQELLNRVEKEFQKVGQGINAKKINFMAYNIEEELQLKLLDGTKLKEVNDFKYLGSWVDSIAAANKMKKI